MMPLRSTALLGLLALAAASEPSLVRYPMRKPPASPRSDPQDPPAEAEAEPADRQDPPAGRVASANIEPRREDFPSRQTFRAAWREWHKRAR